MIRIEPENILFNDSSTDIYEFYSFSNNEAIRRSNNITQTSVLEVKDAECQSVDVVDNAIQTDSKVIIADLGPPNYNHKDLVEFLNSSSRLMSSELMKTLKSSAFQGFFVEWEDVIKDISLSSTLSISGHDSLEISSMTWSSTGSTLAVAFKEAEHSGLCTHKGLLCVWNYGQSDFDSTEPNFKTQTSSCLLALSFNPDMPSMVAGGTYYGDLLVWSDIQNTNFATSKQSDFSHHEPLTGIVWTPGTSIISYNVSLL